MTWLELYNILHTKANDVHNLDSEMWQDEVFAHDAETGKEYPVQIIEVDGKKVVAFNVDELYNNE